MDIPVKKILEEAGETLRLRLLAGGAGLERSIGHVRVETPGLALAGLSQFVEPDRVQVLGEHESDFLSSLDEARRAEVIARYLMVRPACVVVVDDLPVPEPLRLGAEREGVPLFVSSLRFGTFTERLTDYLQERLGETRTQNGVLVDVLGVGVLILGKSGIGKSECGLDLVLRGHRLVADDVVELKHRPPATVYGQSPPLIRHHMEIRGLGIVNLQELYGVAAVRDRKRVDLVVELVSWEQIEEADRLGLQEATYDILGVELPYLVIPIQPGRNAATIVEVAARNLLLKRQGRHSARELQARLERNLATGAVEPTRGEENE
ncbi:MAG: HPr(Ser) kinase/phosphatase [Myxococcales bacterium]|nr:HPr(Ser) kinase/phosphatase [Myxococcales bacterium]